MTSYLKITERKGRLGMQLINHKGDIFLFGRNLISMWKNRGHYIVVKHPNADGKKAIGYHPGQIVGKLSLNGHDVAIHIFKGGMGKQIGLGPDNSLTNIVQREAYVLSDADFHTVMSAFEVHEKHSRDFEDLNLIGASLILDFEESPSDEDEPDA